MLSIILGYGDIEMYKIDRIFVIMEFVFNICRVKEEGRERGRERDIKLNR